MTDEEVTAKILASFTPLIGHRLQWVPFHDVVFAADYGSKIEDVDFDSVFYVAFLALMGEAQRYAEKRSRTLPPIAQLLWISPNADDVTITVGTDEFTFRPHADPLQTEEGYNALKRQFLEKTGQLRA